MASKTENRKLDHINICSDEGVEAKEKSTMLELVDFVHEALPEINIDEIDLSVELFGKKLNAPIIISAMTGGHAVAEKINKNLAKAAQKLGVGFGVGSQRAMIEDEKLAYTYQVRDVAPDILVIGNIGAPQIREYEKGEVQKAVEDIEADVLAVHLNALQEVIQPEGDTDFKGFADDIGKLVKKMKVPVIVKETGAGISKEAAKELIEKGVAGIDTGGAGGTSFAAVEYKRTKGKDTGLWDWGIPTAASILEVRSVSKDIPLIATGGIRTGMSVAKTIALGADAAGIGLPLLNAARESSEKVEEELEKIIDSLKKAMFLTGSASLGELKKKKIVLKGELYNWAVQRGLNG
ncbi:MAG: type 2 isopentenyl-diphosphate Delta-isomerase [archaeon]